MKLAFVCQEIGDVYRQEIEAITGVKSAAVEVVTDRERGMVAHIRIEPIPNADLAMVQSRVRVALSRCTIPYEVAMGPHKGK